MQQIFLCICLMDRKKVKVICKSVGSDQLTQTQKVLAAVLVEFRASGSFLPAVKDDDSHFVGSWEEVYMELF